MQIGKRGGSQFASYGLSPDEFRARAASPALKRRVASAQICLAAARDALTSFDRGCHVFGLSKGQFSMIDIAAAVLEKTGAAAVSVWTWCIAEYEVQAFTAFFQDRRIESLRVVMDWAGTQRDMPLIGELQERFGVDCLRVTKTHAKIVVIANEIWRVVIRGSMNLNANPRFEQFDVSDDPDVFAVVDEMMRELWERGRPLPIREAQHSDATALLNAGEVASSAPPNWAPPIGGKWW